MGGKKPRPDRSFSPEFKAEVVELVRTGGKSIEEVGRETDLTREGGAELGEAGRH
jgi:transposase